MIFFSQNVLFSNWKCCVVSHFVSFHRDSLVSRTSHLKDGLNRLFSLVPYEIITSDIWDYVMPYWMEAIVNDVPEKELHELKNLLRSAITCHFCLYGTVCIIMLQHVCLEHFTSWWCMERIKQGPGGDNNILYCIQKECDSCGFWQPYFLSTGQSWGIRFHTPTTVSLVKIVPIFNFMD